jgi:NADH-quinone oxidoreductase subunit N
VNEQYVISALTGFFPYLIPEMILGTAACVLFLGGTWRADRNLWGAAALLSLALAGVALWLKPLAHHDPDAGQAILYAGPVLLDRMALLIRAVSLVGGAILVLISWDATPNEHAAEYHGCMLLLVAGMGLTAAANDLITLFLALELVSIPTYLMLYLPRVDPPAQEAAMKYFLLSIFSSALTLFGFSYLYGLSGTTNLALMATTLRSAQPLPGVALVALVMVVAGLGFRITAVPFHFYAPDVYQGTATPTAAMLAFVPKVAGFVALLRVLGFTVPVAMPIMGDSPAGPIPVGGVLESPISTSPLLGEQTPMLLFITAAVTMTLGNVLGLLQDNIKRLLAYSSVAHAGYMLIGLAAAPRLFNAANCPVVGVDAVLFYLVAYGAMTTGAFGVLHYLSTPEHTVETMDDMAGLGRTRPGVALLMALFLFSLIGIPFTVGFFGKFWLFLGAVGVPASTGDAAALEQSRLYKGLALLGMVNAAVGAWYYLRITTYMFLREPFPGVVTAAPPKGPRPGWAVLAGVWLCAALTLGLGIFPRPLWDSVHRAVPRPGDLTHGAAEAAPPLRAQHALKAPDPLDRQVRP